jgi:lipoate-protein ligase A
LGVLVTAVPRDTVDDAVAVCGVGERRSGGKLPAHVTAYLTMALCLFSEDDYEEVASKVTGALNQWGCWVSADARRSGWADSSVRRGGHEISGPVDVRSPGHA